MKLLRLHPILILVALLTFSSGVFAQATPTPSASEVEQVEQTINGIMDFPIRTSGDKVEYTHLWFKQMLGGFIFAPWDAMDADPDGVYDVEDQTVLAKALGFTNILAIILCLVIGYYIIVGGAINTASKGQVLGGNWDGPWLALRTSIGFGLLVPLKGIGGMTLSFSQVAVIWLIMIGSNAATLLWNMVGESIISGTQITQPHIPVNSSDVAAMGGMLVCSDMKIRNNSAEMSVPTTGSGGRPTGSSGISEDLLDELMLYKVNYADGTSIPVPAKTGVPKNSEYNSLYWGDIEINEISGSKKQVSSIEFGPGGDCGSISFPHTTVEVQRLGAHYSNNTRTVTEHDVSSDYGDVQATTYKNYALVAGGQKMAVIIEDTLNDLIKMNKVLHPDRTKAVSMNVYKEMMNPKPKTMTDRVKFFEVYDEFVRIAREYNERVNKEVSAATTGSPEFANKIRKEMLKGGWAGAGIWFIELSSIPTLPYQTATQVTDTINYEGTTICPAFWFDSENCETLGENADAYSNILKEVIKRAAENGETFISQKDRNIALCSPGGDCENAADVSDRVSIDVARSILGFLGTSDESSGINPLDNEQSLASPFLFLAEMGQTLNNAAYGAMIGIVAINTVMDVMDGYSKKVDGTLVGIISDLSGASLLTHGIKAIPMSLAKNTAMMIISGLVTVAMAAIFSGFVLAYVIPFMPITTWILMMAGYMLTVVEAIAAAPLAIVLLFTPEGSGIAGSRFERALNLVAMAILRPSFMILGLIGAITVSFVAFSMMNTFFFKAAEHLLSGHLFDAVAIMLIYVNTAYQLAKMMVENMHQLPDRIGEWFAGGVSRQFGESRVNDTAESAVQGAAGQFKSMPGQMMSMQRSMTDTNKRLDGIEDQLKKTNS